MPRGADLRYHGCLASGSWDSLLTEICKVGRVQPAVASGCQCCQREFDLCNPQNYQGSCAPESLVEAMCRILSCKEVI